MDMIQMGKFLKELRKEHQLTQAELARKIGVTNKTISRWETGTYMPPVEMLEALSELYDLTINELLSGKRLVMKEFQKEAEANIKAVLKHSTFTLKDRIDYFKQKWLKDHIAILLFLAIMIAAVFVLGLIKKSLIVLYFTFVLLPLAHAWRNNTMMTYVEKMAFDDVL